MALHRPGPLWTYLTTAGPANSPGHAGELAATKIRFGPRRRFELAPVHTRFKDVAWFVWDTRSGEIVAQEWTAADAVRKVSPRTLAGATPSQAEWFALQSRSVRKRNPARKANPAELVVVGNPGGAQLMSRKVVRLEYVHPEDRESVVRYHDFKAGVQLFAMGDGSLMIRSSSGKPLWKDFR